ncbi:aminotransferase class III-fold pyridoxal phosphate-dependent enzyme [Ruegeria sp.]|uniref:aminotransferase class III-fold pyridoxal phosphate-dependent enzyme n=1 Tax=Ruegeria sp. TaxID=1879320 RepID=UPI002317C05C|nr:aminotransferase class III-fold pyridoxal phosphate-dependent enzyme [Ruegeria sp.]MDA7965375.1 aminotransferase class III-fold pyridoxal phosphate-dependent enzyme [Ruegeria sp.]
MSKLIYTGLNAGKGTSFKVVGGDGVYFHLEDGRKVLDGSNTGGPLGHRHPDMVEAVRKAAENPIINEGWFWKEREQAAEDVIDIAFAEEKDWVGGVRFFLSGGEANDLAMSLAQSITGRTPLATRVRAYHGMSGMSQHLTVQPQWHGGLAVQNGESRPVPVTIPVRQIPEPLGAKYGALSDNRPLSERLEGIEDTLSDTACTILDYTQGGIYYDSEYQDRVARAAKKAGSLWIADEVVTGTGRVGRMFAFQGGETRPDIVTLGKGLAGGSSPVGAVVLSKALVDMMEDKSWQTYSTFRGHSLTVSCIRAYLQVLKRDNLVARVKHLEGIMERRLIEIAQKHPSVARVDGNGLHWTVELHGPDWRTWENNTGEVPIASRVSNRALEAGALIGTSGEQISLFLAPSFIISEEELEGILSALDYGLELADQEYAG